MSISNKEQPPLKQTSRLYGVIKGIKEAMHKKITGWCLSLTLLAFSTFANAGSLDEGIEALDAKDFRKAVRQFATAFEEGPASARHCPRLGKERQAFLCSRPSTVSSLGSLRRTTSPVVRPESALNRVSYSAD